MKKYKIIDMANGQIIDNVCSGNGKAALKKFCQGLTSTGSYEYHKLESGVWELSTSYGRYFQAEEVKGGEEVRRMLRDTPMEWRITTRIKQKSTMEEEQKAILQAMERFKDSILALYPGTAMGRSFREGLDGSLGATLFTDSEKFGFYSTRNTDGTWKRYTQFLFCGTVEEAKKRIEEMARNAEGRNEDAEKITAAASRAKSNSDPLGGYCSKAEFCDGSTAEYRAELYGSDRKRLQVFEIGERIRDAEKEHPGLPVVLIYEDNVIEDKSMSFEVAEFLDYRIPSENNAFASREEFREYLEEHFNGDQERVQEELEKTDPYWVDAILLRVY